jgi:uncharacterized protein
MKAALLHEDGGMRTFALVLEHGDEAVSALTGFAAAGRLGASQFTAIGAFSRAVVAYFEWSSKEYRHVAIDEQVEVLSLLGDITIDGNEPKVHAHVVLAKADATAHGGHLIEGHVRPTLEIVVTEAPGYLLRRFDSESGLALIDPTMRREAGGHPAAGRADSRLARGDQVPHFDVGTVDGTRVRYADLWQHRNLVLVSPGASSEEWQRYAASLLNRAADFSAAETALVVSSDPIAGLQSPGVLVADRWGEIVHVVQAGGAPPDPDDLLEWVDFVRMQCPECPP